MHNVEYRDEGGVYLEIVDLDKLYQHLSQTPIMVNDFDIKTTEDKNQVKELIYTKYDGDALEALPRCDCGKLKGAYREERVCDVCNTAVFAVTERPLESILWMRTPPGVKAFINPEVWTILSKSMSSGSFNVLEWLVNPNYKANVNEPKTINQLKKFKFERSLNYFVENFDYMLEVLEKARVFKGRKIDREHVIQFLTENRHKLFPKVLPIPSKLGFISEESAMGTFADKSMTIAINAIWTITSINSFIIPPTQKVMENRAVKAITQLAAYYQSFFSDTMGGKTGWFRKHIFGGRPHFSFRAVISSISEPHKYDELHLPWSLSVMLMRSHLINKLLKRNYSIIAATTMLNEYGFQYNPLLDEIFQELISESPSGGINCVWQRNPSLGRGSSQCLRITKVKTDPDINTVSMGVLILSGPNADLIVCKSSPAYL